MQVKNECAAISRQLIRAESRIYTTTQFKILFKSMIDSLLTEPSGFALFVLLSCRFERQEAILVFNGWTCLRVNWPSSKVQGLGVELGFARTKLVVLPVV
jgi:hypothetical protein